MKRTILLFASFLMAGMNACYEPQLNEYPFVCGGTAGHPECPEGYDCYGGQCLKQAPECYYQMFGQIRGDADRDFEPNNVPWLAYTLICGDEVNPNCPRRYDVQQQYVNLAVCAQYFTDPQTGNIYGGDRDFYKIYLTMGEQISITLKYNYRSGADLDLTMGAFDSGSNSWTIIKESRSTNDDETIEHTAEFTGWHYIEVRGKSPADMNGYALQWILHSPQ